MQDDLLFWLKATRILSILPILEANKRLDVQVDRYILRRQDGDGQGTADKMEGWVTGRRTTHIYTG